MPQPVDDGIARLDVPVLAAVGFIGPLPLVGALGVLAAQGLLDESMIASLHPFLCLARLALQVPLGNARVL